MGNPKSGTGDKLDKATIVRFTEGSLHCSAGTLLRVVPRPLPTAPD
jgi:hypothetical protein